ncbi:MAG: class I SAM-dependent methyltransferase [Chloroflexi bacterium]|nr:class I SAM-dependent methyltransferase [Chloroflexota bacterium]
MSKWLAKYVGSFAYRYFRVPWDIGPREELVVLVKSGRLTPCRSIDLGSGTASNCVFLAQHGFDVTGIDLASSAIGLGYKRAQEAGVSVNFILDDLTKLRNVSGIFDLLVDYGTLNDMHPRERDLYVSNILPLTHSGSQFLLYCFEWQLIWWEKLLFLVLPFRAALEPGEAKRRFGQYFDIEEISRKTNRRGWPRASAVYLMTRK